MHWLVPASLAWTAGYLLGALAYAAAVTVGALALARAARPFSVALWAPTVLLVLFFVFLTQHPFPSPATMACPDPDAVPQLRPLNFWAVLAERQAEVGWGWLGERLVASSAMNLLLCGAIGGALSRHGIGLAAALGLGLALSLGVELTQLTGTWGLFPCPYRQFDVDDLILNVGGIGSGFALARGLRRRS